MSEQFKKAYEENKKKIAEQRGSKNPPVIKTPWDDAISPEEQARNSSSERPKDFQN